MATAVTITNPLVLYRAKITSRLIKPDPAQHRLAVHLQKLYGSLKDYEPAIEYKQCLQRLQRVSGAGNVDPAQGEPTQSSRGFWSTLAKRHDKSRSMALVRSPTRHQKAMLLDSPKGLMVHGGVGTGKSMLVDLFADCLPHRKKRRWHFSTFMLEVYARLEEFRRRRSCGSGADPEHALKWLAGEMIESSPILFLDEFQMPDRATSKILCGLITAFFQLGGVLVATSNRMPEDLANSTGLQIVPPSSKFEYLSWRLGFGGRTEQAQRGGEFSDFLDLLRARCDIWEMGDSLDHRRTKGRISPSSQQSDEPRTEAESDNAISKELRTANVTHEYNPDLPENYILSSMPASSISTGDLAVGRLHQALASATQHFDGPVPWTSKRLLVYGRTLNVPRQHNGVAFFAFSELCESLLGPADYMSIASNFHTIILIGIPILSEREKNEARRLITLIDALYEARCKLFVTASAGPDSLFFPTAEAAFSTSRGTGRNKMTGKQDSGSKLDVRIQHEQSDAMHSETFAEAYQDLTFPFRPNIVPYNPPEDQLEDDPPNKPRRMARRQNEYDRGREVEDRKSGWREDDRTGRIGPNFGDVGAFTGEDERFSFKRAESRLWEMCGTKWWSRGTDGVTWWQPLPDEMRFWERPCAAEGNPAKHYKEVLTGTEENSAEVRDSLKATDTLERDADAVFPHGACPYRTHKKQPPKFSWVHMWGMMSWGRKAGAWGQGIEGLPRRDDEIRRGKS